MGYLIKPIHMSEEAREKMRQQAIEAALECVRAGECTEENPCCDRRGEYNGFASGPLSFVCPRHCSCHD